jgi:AraC-like DNA-binding protein
MSFTNEGRLSDSPYIESIWRGQAGVDCFPNCPAEGRWHMLLLQERGKMQFSVAGPMTIAHTKSHNEGVEWLVVKFKLGTYMPHLPARKLVDSSTVLPDASHQSFWFNSQTWQTPDFDNVETFVDWLAHDDLLVRDPLVNAALQDQPLNIPERTLRHRFQQVTGLTQSHIRQIERAQYAQSLLEQGVSILDTVVLASYADQPHLTRSLKRFMEQTPAQITPIKIPA